MWRSTHLVIPVSLHLSSLPTRVVCIRPLLPSQQQHADTMPGGSLWQPERVGEQRVHCCVSPGSLLSLRQCAPHPLSGRYAWMLILLYWDVFIEKMYVYFFHRIVSCCGLFSCWYMHALFSVFLILNAFGFNLGVFGNTTGLTDPTCSASCWSGGCSSTSNLCFEGYYCPAGSVTGTQMQCGGAGTFSMRFLLVLGYYLLNGH